MDFYVTAVDIGLHNLGIIKCLIKGSNHEITIIEFKLVDLYKYRNTETELHMLIDCLVSEYAELFNSKYILVERQPPCGLIAIQEVIAFIFKNKVKVISPRSVHSKLGLNYFCYEKRKEKTEEILLQKLNEQNDINLLKQFNKLSRKHDISDAYCMIKYFIKYVIYCPSKKKQTTPKYTLIDIDLDTYFNSFCFKSKKNIKSPRCTFEVVED